jgi:hypothetical protein
MSRSKSKTPSPMLAVYSGQVCIGHVYGRGKTGWDAYDTGGERLGSTWPTREEALKAITAAYIEAEAADAH